MSGLTLSIDSWEGPLNVGASIADASNDEICIALERLDGRNNDSLLIEIDDEHFLGIGGGHDGRFVLSIVDGSITRHLIGDRQAKGVRLLKVGGQQVPYAASRIVSRESARIAVNEFLASRTASPSLEWELKTY